MNDRPEQRRLAAIMFTDMVGFSTLAQRDEKLSLELLAESQRLLRGQFARFNGREVKNTGDGFLVEFPSALESAQCALEIQKALAARNNAQPPERRILVRIGLHVGDVVHREKDIYGDGVNIAARIEPLAVGGGICLSETVYAQVCNKLGIGLVKLESPHLKHIERALGVYRAVLPWESGIPPGAAPSPARPASRNGRPLRLVMATAAVLLLLASITVWLVRPAGRPPKPAAVSVPPTNPPAAATAPRKSIAVLPFVNMSGDQNDDYLSDGMTEELLNVLAEVPGLRVPGRTSCFAFKGRNDEGIFREVGDRLHVNTVLEGSVRKAGDRLRVTAQLINVADGYHLWSKDYDGDMKDILSFQSQVAQRVVEALQVKLGGEDLQALAKPDTENPEAHRLYLLGRHFNFKMTDEDNKKAVQYFKQALELDPHYALAYCGLADTWDIKLPPREYFPQVRQYAETALKLDPRLAEAHVSLAWILMGGEWDLAGAEREFQQAIRLNANLALAHNGYGWALTYQARLPEAESEQKAAVDLDPLSAYPVADLAAVYQCQRAYDQCIQTAKQAVDLDPGYPWGYYELGCGLLYKGQAADALPQFEKARSLGHNPWPVMGLGCCSAALGDRAKAESVIHELDDLAKHQYVTPLAEAYIWVSLNNREQALTQLERGVAEHDPSCAWFKVDPALDRLRAEPRFQTLLKQVGFAR